MNNRIPAYLYEKDNVVRLIIFTALFALLFINMFQPFGSRSWYPDISEFKYFFFSSLIILVGMLVVVISRVIMLKYVKKRPLTYLNYVLWILVEILAMSLFYSLFAKFIPESGKDRDFMEIFQQSTINTSLVLLLPYSILWLYFSWRDKNQTIEKMVNEENPIEYRKKSLLAFSDEKGDFKISIALDNLLYIESADNYITIHYLNKSRNAHFSLRNSLKWVEEHLIDDTPLVRCHRSYIVNLNKVKVFRKAKEGVLLLELESENTPDIPVSKTYYEKVMTKFSPYSN